MRGREYLARARAVVSIELPSSGVAAMPRPAGPVKVAKRLRDHITPASVGG
jgi:hypothetical protein